MVVTSEQHGPGDGGRTEPVPYLVDSHVEAVGAGTPTIERQGLTLVGISVGNLHDDAAVQLALPFDRRCGGADGLDAAVDEVRDRFGSTAVTRAVLLGRGHRPSVPLLPD